jgi:hypothetical protein
MYEVHNPDLTLEGIVGLQESFYLLEPLEERWGVTGDGGCCSSAHVRTSSALGAVLIAPYWLSSSTCR